ncbi:MAG: GyrI-like domain-containing protein [Nocardioides sp.]
MSYDVEMADLQEQPAAVIRAHVTHDGIPGFLGPAFGEVMAAVADQRLHPSGAPFARYRPTPDEGWDIEAGFPVSEAVAPEGRVEPAQLPGGTVALTMHVGDYAALGAAYGAVQDWLTVNGLVPDGEPWECYLDGPDVPQPRTQVFFPCRKAEPIGH